jgi:hypothetical protein
MYSAVELKECENIKKHNKGCKCYNIMYISMLMDNELNLINISDNSIYIYDLYDITLKVLKKLKN